MKCITFLSVLLIFWANLLLESNALAEDSIYKLPYSGYATEGKYVNYNTYGQIVFGSKLLDTSYFAKSVAESTRRGLEDYRVETWPFLNSLWVDDTSRMHFAQFDFQDYFVSEKYELWTGHALSKSHLKRIMNFVRGQLKTEVEVITDLAEIEISNTYSNLAGNLYINMKLIEHQWQHEVRRYENHYFTLLKGEKSDYVIDCSFQDKPWKVGSGSKKYFKELQASGRFESPPDSWEDLLAESTVFSYKELVGLQKMAEAEALTQTNPLAAMYRYEVAQFFYPTRAGKEKMLHTFRSVFEDESSRNDWHKLYALIKYMQLSNEPSEKMKALFNEQFKKTLDYYSENEALRESPGEIINVRIVNSYFSRDILQQDTLNRIGTFDYDNFIGYPVFDERSRGYFHVLRYEKTKNTRGGSDYQFFVDALYIYTYLGRDPELLASIFETDISAFDYGDFLYHYLDDHVKSGAIFNRRDYHEMSAIYFLTYLIHTAPTNKSEVNQISMQSLLHGVFMKHLAEHLSYVTNEAIKVEAKEYVLQMLPVYAEEFMKSKWERLREIGKYCGVDKEFEPYEDKFKKDPFSNYQPAE